jgi:hypothetical protein
MSFLQIPHNLAIDSLNNVYIADTGAAVVSEVLDSSNDYYVIAGDGEGGFSGDGGPAVSAKLSNPYGVAVDSAGNLYIADQLNARIREVATVITPYIYTSTQGRYEVESSVTVSSLSVAVSLGPQPISPGSWSWTGPNGFTSTARQINNIPLSVGANNYVATYTDFSGFTHTQTFTITVQ